MTVAIEAVHWRTGKGEPESVVHEWTEEDMTNEETIKREMHSIRTHASIAVWPQGPAPFVSIFIWLFCIAGSVTKYKVGSPWFNMLKYLASFVFPAPEYGFIALGLIALSHVVEALYVWHILSPTKMSKTGIVSWMAICFSLGYPATKSAMFLRKYWDKHNGGAGGGENKKHK
jgi:hypothetical protein